MQVFSEPGLWIRIHFLSWIGSGSRRENLRKSLVHLQNTLRKVIFLQFFEARSGSALRKKLDLDADPQLSFSLDTVSLSILVAKATLKQVNPLSPSTTINIFQAAKSQLKFNPNHHSPWAYVSHTSL